MPADTSTDDTQPASPTPDQAPKPAETPVDQDAQEEAAEEREKTGGYQ
jgi:hypothetical protein